MKTQQNVQRHFETLGGAISMMDHWVVYRPRFFDYLTEMASKGAVQGVWYTPGAVQHELRYVGNVVYFSEAYIHDKKINGVIGINQHLQSGCDIGCSSCGITQLLKGLKTQGMDNATLTLPENYIGAMMYCMLSPIAPYLNDRCDVRIGFMRDGDPAKVGFEGLMRVNKRIWEVCDFLGITPRQRLIIGSTALGGNPMGLNVIQGMMQRYQEKEVRERFTWQLSFGPNTGLVKRWNEGDTKGLWKSTLKDVANFTRLMRKQTGCKDYSRISAVIGPRSAAELEGLLSFAMCIKEQGYDDAIKIKVTAENGQEGFAVDPQQYCRLVEQIKEKLPAGVHLSAPDYDYYLSRGAKATYIPGVGCGTVVKEGVGLNKIKFTMKSQIIIMYVGFPATGKTTSAQRLHFELSDSQSVELLTTVSIRESLGLMDDLYSETDRSRVYTEMVNRVEERLAAGVDVIILDGNFNKKSRREPVYALLEKHNADILVIECKVQDMDHIRKRLEIRKTRQDDPAHRASSMDLYYMIKDDADPVEQDTLPGGRPLKIIEYSTDNQEISLKNFDGVDEHNISPIDPISSSLAPGRKRAGGRTSVKKISHIKDADATKAFIFDIGGVIQPLRWEAVSNRLNEIKQDITMDDFRNALYYEKERYFGLYEVSKLDKDAFWSMVCKRLGLAQKHVQDVSEAIKFLYGAIDMEMIDFIQVLKKDFKLFVLSNSCPELEEAVLKSSAFYKVFDRMYFSHHMGYKKPHKRCYEVILEENRLKPQECVFVDDVSRNISAAMDIGMKGILFLSGYQLREKVSEILAKGKK